MPPQNPLRVFAPRSPENTEPPRFRQRLERYRKPSGSGKSTLIKTVNGLEPVQQGEITVDGIVVNDKKTDLAKLR
ncbi:ATP-binding cassette domain-containing protein, partial [Escherichia coli]|uniref:ATP-binding cassette domain-containing protein n=1 Tax=Escherichia coli TaxID=562 RepID=UPI00207717C5